MHSYQDANRNSKVKTAFVTGGADTTFLEPVQQIGKLMGSKVSDRPRRHSY